MPIRLELVDGVSSKTSVTGASFALRLAEAIVIDGVELVPAGTPGVGEVVHAKKSGGSGAGGELVVAARYLLLGETRIRLRSMQLSHTGKDQTVLALAASQAIGPFAFAIHGKNTEFIAGTVADAKIAEAVWLPKPAPVSPPVEEAVAACPASATPPAEPITTACPPVATTPEGVIP